MKKVIKVLLSIIAAIFVVAGVWAMSAKKHVSPKLVNYYYRYLPSQASLSMYQDTANWVQTTTPDDEACSGLAIPCIVESDQSSVNTFVSTIHTTADVETAPYASKDGIKLP